MVAGFLGGGEQAVAVEIYAMVRRPDERDRDPHLLQLVGLHAEVPGHGVRAAFNEVLKVPRMRHEDDLGRVQAFVQEHGFGLDLPLVELHHDPLAHQVLGPFNSIGGAGHQDIGRVLVDRCHHHHRQSLGPRHQKI